MITLDLLLIWLRNALVFRRELIKRVFLIYTFINYSRIIYLILLCSTFLVLNRLHISSIEIGIVIYGDLFKITQTFDNIILLFVAVKIYPNADTQKLEILKDNKNKSGIYK